MLNVWSASCGVVSSRTDVNVALLDLSLTETVFDCTRKQKNKRKHVSLGNIFKLTKWSGTDLRKSEDMTQS